MRWHSIEATKRSTGRDIDGQENSCEQVKNLESLSVTLCPVGIFRELGGNTRRRPEFRNLGRNDVFKHLLDDAKKSFAFRGKISVFFKFLFFSISLSFVDSMIGSRSRAGSLACPSCVGSDQEGFGIWRREPEASYSGSHLFYAKL